MLLANLPTGHDSDNLVLGNLRSVRDKGAFTGNPAKSAACAANEEKLLINPTGPPLFSGDFIDRGDRQPDFKGGLTRRIRGQRLSLSFNLISRRGGGDVFNGNEYYLYLTGLSKRTLNREQQFVIEGVLMDGLEETAKPTTNNIAINPYYRTDYWGSTVATEADVIESVDWMRLRDVTLMYRLPRTLLARQKTDHQRIRVRDRNRPVHYHHH